MGVVLAERERSAVRHVSLGQLSLERQRSRVPLQGSTVLVDANLHDRTDSEGQCRVTPFESSPPDAPPPSRILGRLVFCLCAGESRNPWWPRVTKRAGRLWTRRRRTFWTCS